MEQRPLHFGRDLDLLEEFRHRQAKHDVDRREQAGQEERRPHRLVTRQLAQLFAHASPFERARDQLLVHVVGPRRGARHEERQPAVQHLPPDHANGLRNRLDPGAAHRGGIHDLEQLEREARVLPEDALQLLLAHARVEHLVHQLRDGRQRRRQVAALHDLGAAEVVALEELKAQPPTHRELRCRLDAFGEQLGAVGAQCLDLRVDLLLAAAQHVELDDVRHLEERRVLRPRGEVVEGDREAERVQLLRGGDGLVVARHRLEQFDHASLRVEQVEVSFEQHREREVHPGLRVADQVIETDGEDAVDDGRTGHVHRVAPAGGRGHRVGAVQQLVTRELEVLVKDWLTGEEDVGHGPLRGCRRDSRRREPVTCARVSVAPRVGLTPKTSRWQVPAT